MLLPIQTITVVNVLFFFSCSAPEIYRNSQKIDQSKEQLNSVSFLPSYWLSESRVGQEEVLPYYKVEQVLLLLMVQ